MACFYMLCPYADVLVSKRYLVWVLYSQRRTASRLRAGVVIWLCIGRNSVRGRSQRSANSPHGYIHFLDLGTVELGPCAVL